MSMQLPALPRKRRRRKKDKGPEYRAMQKNTQSRSQVQQVHDNPHGRRADGTQRYL